MNFSLAYPIWFIAFCIIAGLLLAGILYVRTKTFNKLSTWLLAALRFAAGFIIAFLLLNPILKWLRNTEEKPIIAIVQDNSTSQQKAFKTINKKQYDLSLAETIKKLQEKYDVKLYTYGNALKDTNATTLTEGSTNIGEALEQVYSTYENDNLGAVVITGDGIFNKGANPTLLNFSKLSSLYVVGIGDTTLIKDLAVQQIYCNKIAFSGDKFAVKIDALGIKCKGQSATITVTNKNTGKVVGTKPVVFNSDKSSQVAELILDAGAKGLQQYTASITINNAEENTTNNIQDFFVEIIDSKEKILIVANSPHPDVFALSEALKVNKNYEVKITTADKVDATVSNYNLVILHNLPSTKYNINSLINNAKQNGVGLLFIVGNQTMIPLLNNVQNAISIKTAAGGTSDALGLINKSFNYFTINEANGNKISALPPLTAAFGQYATGNGTQVLFNQKIGTAATNNPLWVLQQTGGQRMGVIAGEGLWRWRLYDYIQHKNHVIVDEFIQKSIQFLVVKQDKKQFKTHISKNIFTTNETIAFDAELYNDNYELITANDVSLVIVDAKSTRYNFTLNKNEKNYTLDIGTLPEGDYIYETKTSYNGKQFAETGKFKVIGVDIENSNTVADFNLMQQLAKQNNGKFLYHNQVAELANLIPKDANIKNTIKTQIENEPLINWKWLFGILIALLATEWFVRKRNGGY